MNVMLIKYGLPAVLLFTLLGTGCETALPSLSDLVKGSVRLPFHAQVKPLPPGPLCRVAVLPFINDSEFPMAGLIVDKVFSAEFQGSGKYKMIQEGDILKAYQQLHIFPGEAPTPEQLKIIAGRVNAELLVSGIIMEMREDRGEYRTVNPVLILEVQLRDGRDGETLWRTFHRREGLDYKKTMHFGTIHTVTGLSRKVIMEIINLWIDKGLDQCNSSNVSTRF
jgi:hypothetical protein